MASRARKPRFKLNGKPFLWGKRENGCIQRAMACLDALPFQNLLTINELCRKLDCVRQTLLQNRDFHLLGPYRLVLGTRVVYYGSRKTIAAARREARLRENH